MLGHALLSASLQIVSSMRRVFIVVQPFNKSVYESCEQETLTGIVASPFLANVFVSRQDGLLYFRLAVYCHRLLPSQTKRGRHLNHLA